MNINELVEKMKSEELSYEEVDSIVSGYVNGTVDDESMTLFIKSIYDGNISYKELVYLTNSMIKSGEIVDFSGINKPVIDKHSTGGVGDKTTLIVGPIVASLGIGVPKMSGRGLGFTGGTIDKLESINGYDIDLSVDELKTQINEIGISVIGQSQDMCVADKKIYALRNEKNLVDSIPLIASSVMSKKIACGCPYIVIDLKVGAGAFMKTIEDARNLAKIMVAIGQYYKRKVVCVLSDMNYPIGRTIGNALEVKEAIDFFEGKYDERLKRLCFYLSSVMVSIIKKIKYDDALKLVTQTYENGNAKKKFNEWITYQKGNISSLRDFSKKVAIKSLKSGYINNVDTLKLAGLCKSLGAGRETSEMPIDYSVGVELLKTIGDKVERGEILGTIYYNKEVENMESIFRDSFTIESNQAKINDIILEIVE